MYMVIEVRSPRTVGQTLDEGLASAWNLNSNEINAVFFAVLFTSALLMVLGEQCEAEISRTPVGRPGPLAAQASISGHIRNRCGRSRVVEDSAIFHLDDAVCEIEHVMVMRDHENGGRARSTARRRSNPATR